MLSRKQLSAYLAKKSKRQASSSQFEAKAMVSEQDDTRKRSALSEAVSKIDMMHNSLNNRLKLGIYYKETDG